MNDRRKTKAQLLEELTELRQEVVRLKTVEQETLELKKQAEESLRQAESRYELLLDTVPVAIYTKDLEGRYTSVNADTLTYWIRNPLGYTDADILPEAFANKLRQADLQVIKTEKELIFEEDLQTPEGLRIVLSRKIPLRDADGKMIGILGTSLDITERKRIENELRASQERYEVAVRGSNDGLWDWDLISNEVYFSPRWKSMIGYEDDQISNDFAEFEDRLHPEDHDWVMTSVQDYLGGNLPVYQVEFRFRHKNGSYRWILSRGAALRDETGQPYRLAGSHTDITEHKKTEEALVRRISELETIAQVGTAAATILDAEKLLQTVVDLTKERLNLYHAHIYLFDEAAETLTLAAGADQVGRRMAAEGWRIPLDQERSLVARAARRQKGVIVNDVQADPGYFQNPLLPNTRSEMAVPMIVGEQLLGVLDVQSDVAHRFTEEDARLKSILASQVAVALQNARLYAQTQRQVERERLVNTISQKIQNTLTIESALKTAVQELGQALQAGYTRIELTRFEKLEQDESSPNGPNGAT